MEDLIKKIFINYTLKKVADLIKIKLKWNYQKYY